MSESFLAGTSALVTGASRGIGAAVARRLAAAGVHVHLLARSEAPLEALARETAGTAWTADLRRADSLVETLGRLTSDHGLPDLVVNSAGVFGLVPLAHTPVDLFDDALAINLRAPFLVIRALLPAMLARGSGTIVSIGSVAGHRAFPMNGAYSASKFGLRGLHEVLAVELEGTGVRSTLIEPAATDTPLWDPYDPDGSPDLPDRAAMLRPEEVADAVLFAATRPPGVRLPLLRVER